MSLMSLTGVNWINPKPAGHCHAIGIVNPLCIDRGPYSVPTTLYVYLRTPLWTVRVRGRIISSKYCTMKVGLGLRRYFRENSRPCEI